MKEKNKTEQRFCGNCTNHNAYDYPNQVFCTRRFLKYKNAIVETLSCCEEWIRNPQECHCIEEAMQGKKK